MIFEVVKIFGGGCGGTRVGKHIHNGHVRRDWGPFYGQILLENFAHFFLISTFDAKTYWRNGGAVSDGSG